MRKLFLTSYFTEVASMLPDFLRGDCVGKKVVVIPTAALHETVKFYVDTDRDALQKLGFIIDDLDILNVEYRVAEESISNADIIFVGGGNTFFLLQELKRTGVDNLIVEHVSKGKPYISTSAGSCILSRNIVIDGIESLDVAPDLNGDFSALSIVDFYIYPHYGQNYFEKSDKQIVSKYYDKLDVKLISDKQAVIVDDDKIDIVTAKGESSE